MNCFSSNFVNCFGQRLKNNEGNTPRTAITVSILTMFVTYNPQSPSYNNLCLLSLFDWCHHWLKNCKARLVPSFDNEKHREISMFESFCDKWKHSIIIIMWSIMQCTHLLPCQPSMQLTVYYLYAALTKCYVETCPKHSYPKIHISSSNRVSSNRSFSPMYRISFFLVKTKKSYISYRNVQAELSWTYLTWVTWRCTGSMTIKSGIRK